MNKQKVKKGLELFLKIGITTLAIYIVLKKIDIQALWENIKNANPGYLLLALLVFVLSKIIEALRINVFYKVKGIILGQIENFKLYMLGLFYNLFLPGGIGGDGYKIYWLRKIFKSKIKHLVLITLLNRINGLFGLFILLVVFAQFISYEVNYLTYTLAFIPVAYIIYHFVLKIFFKDFLKTLPITTLQSILVQFLQLVMAHFILLALGYNDNYFDYWFIFLASGIAFVIPVTLGGLGSREIVFLYAGKFLNININLAIAMSLLFYLIRSIVCLAGSYFVIYPNKIQNNQ